MTTVRLRHLAQVNPLTLAFDRLSDEDELTFLPMEAVWPGSRLDITRRRTKASVATGYTRFQDGDVLVPKITPTFEAGRAVLIGGLLGGVGAGTTELHVVRPGPYIDPGFLLYVVNTHGFLKLGEAEMYGVAGQQRVPDSFLRDLPVELPPLEAQRRIADFLDVETARIDRLVALQVTLRAKIDERDKALRDNLVNELAKTVGEVPLRRFTTRIEQGASPQCEAVPRQGDDEWGVLKLSAVKGGRFVPFENKRLPEGTEAISAYQVRRGDLLVTRANTPSLVGDVAVVEGNHHKLLLPDLIYRVGLVPEMNADFVAQVALSGRVRTLIESVARGSSQSMVKLRGEDIKTWPMPMATQTQQTTLVQKIQSGMQGTGRLRTTVARQLSLLAERRQALITAAVTGQFDVSTASGRNVTDGVSA